jgi:hypothetical protein
MLNMQSDSFESRLVYSCAFYLLAFVLVVVSKPDAVFEPNSTLKAFGTGTKKTLVPLGVVTAVLATISFYMFTVLDLVLK